MLTIGLQSNTKFSNSIKKYIIIKYVKHKRRNTNSITKKGLSMRKLIQQMDESGYETCSIGGFSKMLKTKSIKFEKVQEILDFLGYKIDIIKK